MPDFHEKGPLLALTSRGNACSLSAMLKDEGGKKFASLKGLELLQRPEESQMCSQGTQGERIPAPSRATMKCLSKTHGRTTETRFDAFTRTSSECVALQKIVGKDTAIWG